MTKQEALRSIIYMATIHVEEKINQDLKKASKLMGVKKKELIDRALLYYLGSVRDLLHFRKELDAWDELSDEAMQKISKSAFLRA